MVTTPILPTDCHCTSSALSSWLPSKPDH